MKLAAYMKSENITDAEFALKVKRDRSTVTRWRLTTLKPHWTMFPIIEVATGGKVTWRDFLPEIEVTE